MAAPTLRDSIATNTSPSSASVSATLPTYSAGDQLVVAILPGSNRTVSAFGDGSWTLAASRAALGYYVYEKIAAGTEGSSISITLSGSTTTFCAIAASFEGADEGAAFGNTDTDSNTTIVAPAVTVATADSIQLRVTWCSYHTPAISSNGGLTEITTGGSATSKRLKMWYSSTGVSAGAGTTESFTVGASYTCSASTLVIPPSAAVAPTISSVTLSGTSQIGNTLTATVVTDQDPVDSTAYQWEKASDGSGTGAADISGKTSSTLALTYADFGDLLDTAAYVRCGAIATKNALPSDEAFSAWQQVTVPSSAGLVSSPLKSPFLIA